MLVLLPFFSWPYLQLHDLPNIAHHCNCNKGIFCNTESLAVHYKYMQIITTLRKHLQIFTSDYRCFF